MRISDWSSDVCSSDLSSVGAALDISARFQAVDQPADRNLPDIQLPRKVHLHHTFIASTREPRQNRPLRSGDTQRFHALVEQGAPPSRHVVDATPEPELLCRRLSCLICMSSCALCWPGLAFACHFHPVTDDTLASNTSTARCHKAKNDGH